MIRIAIANQKGGVGKTTTAINIATAMAAIGWRTLLVDLDPQGNASTGLGIPGIARTKTTYDLLVNDASVSECAVPTTIPNLDVLPSTVDLSGAELELVAEDDRATRLRDALAHHRGHQICFIDCPPSLGLLTLNALTAADTLLVPLQCEFFALAQVANYRRYFMELGFLRRTPAALSGDQLVAAAGKRADDHWLDHPACCDRLGQLVQRIGVEAPPRLIGMRFDGADREIGEAVAWRRGG